MPFYTKIEIDQALFIKKVFFLGVILEFDTIHLRSQPPDSAGHDLKFIISNSKTTPKNQLF